MSQNATAVSLRSVMFYFFRLTTSFLFSCRAGIIEGSAMVEVSPSSLSSAAILRRMRLMILPERVFGSDGASYGGISTYANGHSLRMMDEGKFWHFLTPLLPPWTDEQPEQAAYLYSKIHATSLTLYTFPWPPPPLMRTYSMDAPKWQGLFQINSPRNTMRSFNCPNSKLDWPAFHFGSLMWNSSKRFSAFLVPEYSLAKQKGLSSLGRCSSALFPFQRQCGLRLWAWRSSKGTLPSPDGGTPPRQTPPPSCARPTPTPLAPSTSDGLQLIAWRAG